MCHEGRIQRSLTDCGYDIVARKCDALDKSQTQMCEPASEVYTDDGAVSMWANASRISLELIFFFRGRKSCAQRYGRVLAFADRRNVSGRCHFIDALFFFFCLWQQHSQSPERLLCDCRGLAVSVLADEERCDRDKHVPQHITLLLASHVRAEARRGWMDRWVVAVFFELSGSLRH